MTRVAALVVVALAAQTAASVIDWESITGQQFRSLPAWYGAIVYIRGPKGIPHR